MKQRTAMLWLLLLCSLFTPLAFSQQETQPAVADNQSQRERLENRLAAINQQQSLLESIAERSPSSSEAVNGALRDRTNQERIDLITRQLGFARAVAGVEAQSDLYEEFAAPARAYLDDNLRISTAAWSQLEQAAVYPDVSLSAVEQTLANRVFFDNLETTDRLMALADDSLEAMEALEYDTTEARATYLEYLQERAIGLSVYLTLAQQQVADKRAAASTSPADADLVSQQTLAANRVNTIADSLRAVVNELESLDAETTDFREQLLVTSGAITADALNTQVLSDLLAVWSGQVLDYVINEGPDLLISAFVFLLVLIIAFRLSRIARRMMERGLTRSKLKLSELLRRMIVSTLGNLVLAIGILFALAQIGISLGPLLAGLGIAGFIIGFALQDSLSNFASGMMILFYRPYDVGDVVELNGVAGQVEQMSLVNTTINTFDNQRIIVPNTMIWGGIIKNVTAQEKRRVDMMFGIAYSDDIEMAENLLKEIVASHELVLADPEPIIRLHELGDSSVNFIVRPWTKTENYWAVYWDITRGVKLRFDQEGVSIPFPQRDVHFIPAANQPQALVPSQQSPNAATREELDRHGSQKPDQGSSAPAAETVDYPETQEASDTEAR